MYKGIANHRGLKYRPVARKKFSNMQQDVLSEMFDTNPYPNRLTRTMISNTTGLDVEQIRVWFQNKRARVRVNLQRGAGTNSPTKAASASANRNDKRASGKEEVSNSSPSEMIACNSIVAVLNCCKEALSGWEDLSAPENPHFNEAATDTRSDTFEDERIIEAVQNLLEA